MFAVSKIWSAGVSDGTSIAWFLKFTVYDSLTAPVEGRKTLEYLVMVETWAEVPSFLGMNAPGFSSVGFFMDEHF